MLPPEVNRLPSDLDLGNDLEQYLATIAVSDVDGEDGLALAGAGTSPTADEVVSEADLKIVISKHGIHREDNRNTPEHTFVVSKEKWFTIELKLVDTLNRLAVHNTLEVEVGLVFESGSAVPVAGPHEQLLHGQHLRTTFIDGLAHFKLKMGPTVLSQRHGEQKFRVVVQPTDEGLRSALTMCTIHSAPMKSVTKLFRNKQPAASNALAVAGAARPLERKGCARRRRLSSSSSPPPPPPPPTHNPSSSALPALVRVQAPRCRASLRRRARRGRSR